MFPFYSFDHINGSILLTFKVLNIMKLTFRHREGKILWSEVLTAVSMKMAVCWVVAPCRLVWVYRRFRGPYCLHDQVDDLTWAHFLCNSPIPDAFCMTHPSHMPNSWRTEKMLWLLCNFLHCHVTSWHLDSNILCSFQFSEDWIKTNILFLLNHNMVPHILFPY
jgi:hypothetical protein